MFHLLRGLALLLGPVVGYTVGKTGDAALVGLGVAALVVAVELIIERIPLDVLVFGAIGASGGVIVAKGIDWLIYRLDNPVLYQFVTDRSLLVNLVFAYLGCMIAVRKKGELDLLDKNLVVKSTKTKEVKIIDTSVLIDGRIADVVETGFLSGNFLVPRFVLQELQAVADSSDATKRQRGRRGLDVLKRLQDSQEVVVKIFDKDFPDIKEVDAKLVQLAKDMNGKVATTDFNLSKVAALQGVAVLNVNDLAGSLKSVVLPGDNLVLFLAKEGKEKQQAVGYLDDGTMVVVDDGRRFLGKRVSAHVNSILQTPAGRMIFARAQEVKDTPLESSTPHSPPQP
ncbi:MAG: putative PIN and TRAM-domain containing protein YacL [Elusimicrobia bacterium]|nr:putative PIN and TRAM-domain containing protein YacL [Elusimicrobiota bacterium]